MADALPLWHAEGTISFTSFITRLLRTDLEPTFPINDIANMTFWANAGQQALTGMDQPSLTNLPRGISDNARARLFHERCHYAQVVSYPVLQLKFLYEMEKLRVTVLAQKGSPSVICGEQPSDRVADPQSLAREQAFMDAVMMGDPVCDLSGAAEIAGVHNAAVVPATLTTGAGLVALGGAGLLGFEDGNQIVPFSVMNLLESSAQVSQQLFHGDVPRQLLTTGTPHELRYLGCWEVWRRLQGAHYSSEADLATAFLAAVDLALGAHIRAQEDSRLRDAMQQLEFSNEMRFPHTRFGAIVRHAGSVQPYAGGPDPLGSVADYQRRLCQRLGWPSPDHAYRFMAALLTQRLLYSSMWAYENTIEFDEEGLRWAILTPLSDIAENLDGLRPAWHLLADSFDSGLRGAANIVIGSRVVAKMIESARLRTKEPLFAATPHLDPAALSDNFELPCIHIGNQYYMEWDLSDSADMQGQSLETLVKSIFRIPTIDMLSDCVEVAALQRIGEDHERCGLIDPVTRQANCLYVAAGAGCPQLGLTAEEHKKRQDHQLFDWCHWTFAAMRTGAASAEVRKEWFGRWSEVAITARQDAAATFRETGDRPGEGMALEDLGLALREAGRFEEAITAHQDAAVLFRETGDRDSEGMALSNLGFALHNVSRLEEAITAQQHAAAIWRETGNRPGEGMALNLIGLALREAGRFEEAITAHQDAAAISRETGDRPGEGMALGNLGLALREAGRFEEAITAHQDAAALFRETGDRSPEGMALDYLGVALREAGRFEKAITTHQDAATLFREIGEWNREGIALNNLGVALREAGRFEKAITAHQDAVTLFRETGDWDREGVAQNNLETAQAAKQA